MHITKPTFDALLKLAQTFGITLDFLVYGEAVEERIGDQELLNLVRQADNFSYANKQLAKGLLHALTTKEKSETS